MPKDSKKKPRKLKNVTIDKIALVDNPAVPKATFAIVKRDTSMIQEETVEGIEKAGSEKVKEAFLKAVDDLRKVAGEMDERGLFKLSELMHFTRAAYDFSNEVNERLDKCLKENNMLIIKCNADPPTDESSAETMSEELGTEVISKQASSDSSVVEADGEAGSETSVSKQKSPSASTLDQAAELLAKQEKEQAEKEQAETDAVLKALDGLTSELKATREEIQTDNNRFYRELAKARGKVFDDEAEGEKESDSASTKA